MTPLPLLLIVASSVCAAPRYEVKPFDRSQLARGARLAFESANAAVRKSPGGDSAYHPLTKTRAYIERLTRALAAASGVTAATSDMVVRVEASSSDLTSQMREGGLLIIASQLVRQAKSEDEIAAVIGHEIVHHTHIHTYRIHAGRFSNLTGRRSSGGGGDIFGGGGTVFTDEEKKGLRLAEIEADIIGLRVLVNAGYDPEAAVSVLSVYENIFQNEPRLRRKPSSEDPHPPLGPRTAGLREAMKRDGMTPTTRRPVPPEVVAELAEALEKEYQDRLVYCKGNNNERFKWTARKTAWGTVTACEEVTQ